MRILITGTSAGFGRLFVETLLKKGHIVAASMRDVGGKNKQAAYELRKAGAYVVELDVTNDRSVEKGVAKAIKLAGGLDAVVNNAGVGVLGLQEAFTIDDWKRLFEINVYGVQRVCRAVLPHFRENGEGLIVNISSILGRMTLPFFGPYNASKWALEALTEGYRTELSGLGIETAIIEPGGFQTSFMDRLIKPGDKTRQKAYGGLADAPVKMMEDFGKALGQNPEQKPQNVADALVSVIEAPPGTRPFRTVVDKMGMGDPIEGYNEQLERITEGIYLSFGLDGMLKVKTPVS